MQELLTAFNNSNGLHHAYLLVGNPVLLRVDLEPLLVQAMGTSLQGHPDVWFAEFDVFGVDDSRQLRERQSRMPVRGEKQFFILAINFITVEAQNALLKTLEEPTTRSHFFILTPNAEVFLPTVRSRCVIITAAVSEQLANPEVKKFLTSEPAVRLKIIEKMLGGLPESAGAEAGGKSEPNPSAIKRRAINFLNELEAALHTGASAADLAKLQKVFTTIAESRSYLHDRAASPRLILEHLVFILPIC